MNDDLATALAQVLATAEGFETFADAESDPLIRSFLWGRIAGGRSAVTMVTKATGTAPSER